MASFRIFRRPIIEAFNAMKSSRFIIGPALLATTKRIMNIEVNHMPRKGETSSYSMLKLIKTTFFAIFNNTTAPLKLITGIGVIISISSFGYATYLLVKYFLNQITVPGYTSLMLILLFILGIIVLILGILGEYTLRIINSLNNEQYNIRQSDG